MGLLLGFAEGELELKFCFSIIGCFIELVKLYPIGLFINNFLYIIPERAYYIRVSI